MALKYHAGSEYPPNRWYDTTWTRREMRINDVGEKVVFIIQCPKDISTTGVRVERIGFCTMDCLVSAPLKVSIQGVNLATGRPDGNVRAYGVVIPIVRAGLHYYDCSITEWSAGVNIPRGSYMAVVIEFLSNAGDIKIIGWYNSGGLQTHFPFCLRYSVGWVKHYVAPSLGLKYSDGSYPIIDGCVPAEEVVIYVEPGIGVKFKLPFKTSTFGFWVVARLYYDNYNIICELRDQNFNLLNSVTLYYTLGDYDSPTRKLIRGIWSAPQVLEADNFYYLLFKQSGGVSNDPFCGLRNSRFDYLQNYIGIDNNFFRMYYTNQWMTENTPARTIPAMGLLLDKFDEGKPRETSHVF